MKWLARRRLNELDALVNGTVENKPPSWWSRRKARARIWFRHTFRSRYLQAKWAWQRSQRGWSDADIWNMDGYLAGVVAGMLNHMRQHTSGHPTSLTYEAWLAKLTELETAFQHYADNLHDVGNFDYEKALEQMRPLFDKEVYGSLWD